MKKLLVIISFLAPTSFIWSQWTTSGTNIYYNTGNVDIGASELGGKLQVSDGGGEPIKYGSLQIVRSPLPANNQFYVSFIRGGISITGMGYLKNSNF
jgi:hypothetical protein